jgi:hypothetical protein
MGILSTIINKVFGDRKESAAPDTGAVETVVAAAVTPAEPVVAFDVAGYLNGLAGRNKEKLDWTVSIVDLLKLIGMDSSLTARKELARELGYGEDMADSAKMNIWLHRQVMQQIAKNGGQLPSDLAA